MIRIIDGGMICPSVPEAQMVPHASGLSYLYFSMTGSEISPMAITEAATTPVVAYDTDSHHASAAQQIAAAHHAIPGHGMMKGAPHSQRPRLGVALGEMSQQQLDAMQLEYGVRITEVMPGSPAAEAGIETGDVVTEVDGRPAYSPERMQYLVNEATTSPTITLRRDAQKLRLEATLGGTKSAGSHERAMLGVRIQAMTDDLKEAFGAQGGHGVLISQVKQGSAAGEAGMKAGDVIVRIGEDDITDVRDVYRVVGGHAPGDEVVVSILRDRQPQMLRLALGSAPDTRQAQAMHPHAMHGYGHGFKHGKGIGYRHGHDGFHGYNKNSGCHVGKMLRPS